jgi:hypothetical protein
MEPYSFSQTSLLVFFNILKMNSTRNIEKQSECELVKILAEYKAEIAKLKEELARSQAENDALVDEVTKLSGEKTKLVEEKASYQAIIEELREENASSNARIVELEKRLAAAETASTAGPSRAVKRTRSGSSLAPNPEQQQFSCQPEKNVKKILPDFPSEYEKLRSFPVKTASTNSDDVSFAARTLAIAQRMLDMHNLGEAGCSIYAAVVLCVATMCLKKATVVTPQYWLSWPKAGHSYADWVVRTDEKIHLVVEAKANDLTKGVAQNARQLFAAYHTNLENRCYGVGEKHIMRGIVTTAEEWVFTKLDFGRGKPQLTRGKTTLTLPLKQANMKVEDLEKDLQEFIDCFSWFMSN